VDIDLAIKDDSTVCFTAWTLAAVGVNDLIKRQQLDLPTMTFESTLEGPVAVEREGLDTWHENIGKSNGFDALTT